MNESSTNKANLAGEEVYQHYLSAYHNGDIQVCYEILPHLSVSKDKRFLPLLKNCLFSGNREREELAICGLAALGDSAALEWLFQKLESPELFHGAGSHKLQAAIIDAIGEIGDDRATPRLMEIFEFRLKNDNFRRNRMVITVDAIGALAQQGGELALANLRRLLDHEEFLIRAQAVTAICTAYWHRPNEIPAELFEKLLSLFRDSNLYVQYSLISAMENLADLGCELAAQLFTD